MIVIYARARNKKLKVPFLLHLQKVQKILIKDIEDSNISIISYISKKTIWKRILK